MSGQVASHARHRPFFQGTVVTPSGRFPVTPVLVHSPVGSRVARTSALRNARCIMPLILLWRDSIVDRHFSCMRGHGGHPMSPYGTTTALVCEPNAWIPNLRPTAILTDELSIFSNRSMQLVLRPCSQSPDPSDLDANNLACSTGSAVPDKRLSARFRQMISSQFRSFVAMIGCVAVWLGVDAIVDQVDKVGSILTSLRVWSRTGRRLRE